MQLNFTISELIKSDTAATYGIDNTPDSDSLDNMLELIVNCLQPIRDKLDKPMIITSGYRNSQVNTLVGGVAASQHTKGQAADFKVSGYTPSELVKLIQTYGTDYDQLINEYDKWVHISYVKGNNRKQVLKY